MDRVSSNLVWRGLSSAPLMGGPMKTDEVLGVLPTLRYLGGIFPGIQSIEDHHVSGRDMGSSVIQPARQLRKIARCSSDLAFRITGIWRYPLASLDDHYVHRLISMESMSPSTPPLVRIARFPFGSCSHPSNMIQHQTT